MKRGFCKRIFALLLALCVLCGSAGLAEADRGTIQQVQEALNAAGFDCGTPDGISGKKTRSAIEAYQEANGLTASGEITEELLSHMGIELPGAEEGEAEGAAAELKEVKGNSPVRGVRVPIGGPLYVSDFDSAALRNVPYLRWNLRIRVVGTVDELSGKFPAELQKYNRMILVRAADGNLFLADYSKSEVPIPDFRAGDTLTVSGSVGEPLIGVIQREYDDYFFWKVAYDSTDSAYESIAEEGGLEPSGDLAQWIHGDWVALDVAPAPVVKFESIAVTPEHRLGTVVRDMLAGLDVEEESGWLFFGDYVLGKGYGGGFSPLINYYTGMVIPYDNGTGSYLCDDCILQFEWRDAETGEIADSHRVYRYFIAANREGAEYDVAKYGEPRSFRLYAKIYNFDGSLREERSLGDFREDEIDARYIELNDAMDGIERECKIHMNGRSSTEQEMLDNRELINFMDEDGDAVGYDSEGRELIRYPDTEASMLQGLLLKKQGIITVSFLTSNDDSRGVKATEVFFPDDGASDAQSEAEPDLVERIVPLSSEENTGFFVLEDSIRPNLELTGTVTDLSGSMPLELQGLNHMIPLQTADGKTYIVEDYYFDMGTMREVQVEIPEYQIGDVLTVRGRPLTTRDDFGGDVVICIQPEAVTASGAPGT